MSTAQLATIQRVEDVLRLFDDHDPKRNVAIAVVNTIYPEITQAKQLAGVPEGSILITTRPDVIVYRWQDGNLHTLRTRGPGDSFNPVYIIMDWGPLTVVWMP